MSDIRIVGMLCALVCVVAVAVWISSGVVREHGCIAGSVEALFTSCEQR